MDISEENHFRVIKARQEAAQKNQLIQTVLTELGQLQNQIEVLKNMFKLSPGPSQLQKAVHCLQVGNNEENSFLLLAQSARFLCLPLPQIAWLGFFPISFAATWN